MKRLLRWLTSIALLGLALYLLDWTSILASASELTLGVLSLAVLLCSASVIPQIARWYLLVDGAGGWYLCSARYLYGIFINSVSPGSIGGDVYRFYAFRDPNRSSAALVAVLLRERLFGLASMLIGLFIGTVAMLMRDDPAQQWLVRTLAIAAAGGLIAILLLPRIVEYLPARWRSALRVALVVNASGRDAALLAWSLAALSLWMAAVQLVAVNFGLQIPLSVLLVIVTAVELVRFIPVTVQGVGIREGGFATLFGAFGFANEDGFVLGAVAYIALNVSAVLLGALGAWLLARREPAA